MKFEAKTCDLGEKTFLIAFNIIRQYLMLMMASKLTNICKLARFNRKIIVC